MRIAIDISFIASSVNDKGGVYHYLFNLIRSLELFDRKNTYILWYYSARDYNIKNADEIKELLRIESYSNFIIKRTFFPYRLVWGLQLPVELFLGKVDIFHGPAHFALPTLAGKSVVTVHDIDFAVVPQYLDRRWVSYKRKHTVLSLKRADAVITVSEYMKQELMDRFPLDGERIHVVHHGISDAFGYEAADDHTLNRPGQTHLSNRILFVGTFHRNKNVVRLIEAFKILKMKGLPHHLTLAGGPGKGLDDVMHAIKRNGLDSDVELLGFVSEGELAALYQASSLFVLPSLYEGFGIPVIEAFAAGIPVIASNVCSLPEIVGDAGILFDPTDIRQIADAMLKVAMDSNLRSELVKRGKKRVGNFSWKKAAEETVSVYERVRSRAR